MSQPESETVFYDAQQLAPAWALLPGGPEATHDGESWQYMGSTWDGQRATHQFRHRAHPAYDGQKTYAYVVEDDQHVELLNVFGP